MMWLVRRGIVEKAHGVPTGSGADGKVVSQKQGSRRKGTGKSATVWKGGVTSAGDTTPRSIGSGREKTWGKRRKKKH